MASPALFRPISGSLTWRVVHLGASALQSRSSCLHCSPPASSAPTLLPGGSPRKQGWWLRRSATESVQDTSHLGSAGSAQLSSHLSLLGVTRGLYSDLPAGCSRAGDLGTVQGGTAGLLTSSAGAGCMGPSSESPGLGLGCSVTVLRQLSEQDPSFILHWAPQVRKLALLLTRGWPGCPHVGLSVRGRGPGCPQLGREPSRGHMEAQARGCLCGSDICQGRGVWLGAGALPCCGLTRGRRGTPGLELTEAEALCRRGQTSVLAETRRGRLPSFSLGTRATCPEPGDNAGAWPGRLHVQGRASRAGRGPLAAEAAQQKARAEIREGRGGMTLPREVRAPRGAGPGGTPPAASPLESHVPRKRGGVRGMPSLARSQVGRGWVTLA